MISPLSCKGSFSGDQKRDISKVKIPDCLVRFPYFWCDGEVNIGFQICNKLNVFDRCFRVARVCCKVISYVESRSKKTYTIIFHNTYWWLHCVSGILIYCRTIAISKVLNSWNYLNCSKKKQKKLQLASLFPRCPLQTSGFLSNVQSFRGCLGENSCQQDKVWRFPGNIGTSLWWSQNESTDWRPNTLDICHDGLFKASDRGHLLGMQARNWKVEINGGRRLFNYVMSDSTDCGSSAASTKS